MLIVLIILTYIYNVINGKGKNLGEAIRRLILSSILINMSRFLMAAFVDLGTLAI